MKVQIWAAPSYEDQYGRLFEQQMEVERQSELPLDATDLRKGRKPSRP